MKYARVFGKEVVEIFHVQDGFTIDDSIHHSIRADFVEIPEDEVVLLGYTYSHEHGTFAPPPEPKVEEPAPEPTAE